MTRGRHPHASPKAQAAVRRAGRQAQALGERGYTAPRYNGWLSRLAADQGGPAAVEALHAWLDEWNATGTMPARPMWPDPEEEPQA